MAIFQAANILLPDFEKVDGEKWAVIACDQFTSEPEYWQMAESLIGDAPSARWLTYPEVYLEEGFGNLGAIRDIHSAMQKYKKKLLKEHRDTLILVRRTLPDGRVRTGLVGMIDLEAYDYGAGTKSPIRPTEGTVLSRIPPRVQIRDGASMELPHVLLLINDKDRSVLEPLIGAAEEMPLAYSFPLMLGGGSIEGRFLSEEAKGSTLAALAALEAGGGITYAVGDGNHSLASAKACYEEAKGLLGEKKAKKSPLRYALVELENIYDEAIEFHPIYRAVFHIDPQALLAALPKGEGPCHEFEYFYKGNRGRISLPKTSALPVGTLQNALDDYVAAHKEAVVDYIHGEDSLMKLAEGEGAIGFLFEGMQKEDLFPSVEKDGALPRKTFSMGEAQEKRYYVEGRSLT